MNKLIFQLFFVVKMTERRKNQSEEWTYFTQLFIYFITVNKYRFCISVIRYINVQIIGIGNTKIYICRSLDFLILFNVFYLFLHYKNSMSLLYNLRHFCICVSQS